MTKMPRLSLADMRRELEGWPHRLRAYQTPDRFKAWMQVLTTFGPFIALWIAMYYSLSISFWLTLGLGMINGFFMVKIFIIQHDCGHYSYLKSRRVMKILGHVCSLFCSIPFTYWAKQHDYHHAHNGQLDQRDVGDIKTYTVRQYRALSPLHKLRYKLFRFPAILFGLGSFYYLLIHNRIPIVRLKSFKRLEIGLLLNNLAIAAIYIGLALAIGWKKFLVVHLITIFFFAVYSVWMFYIQHQHEETYKNYKNKWEYLLAAVRGSSWYDIHPIFHWLTGNIGYHHIHHLNPRIPSYNLKRCAVENPIFGQYATRLKFSESLKLMHHKLWDEDTRRMITFREYQDRFDT